MKRLQLAWPAMILAIALSVGLGKAQPAHAATAITVNTTSDQAVTDGKCSLREAIDNANANVDTTGGDCVAGTPGADTLDLSSLSGAITLTSDLPTIGDDLTITGPGPGVLTVNANGHGQVFVVGPVAATITGLTMTGAAVQAVPPPAPPTGNGILSNGELTVRNSTITGNHAFGGGGIESLGSSLIVEASTVTGNSGGGIATESPTATIENTTISGNSGIDFGGGIINTPAGPALGATLTVENSTISGNKADSVGGAIENQHGATLIVVNSTISGNSARIETLDNWGTATVISSTIAGNSGAVGVAGDVRLENTIVAAQKGGWDCGQAGPDGGYNLADDGTCGFSSANHSLSNTDPLLDPTGLQDNSGPTQTIALEPGSPAVDAIPAGVNGCGTTITSDQGGISRPQGSGCDIGAFEVPQQAPAQQLLTLQYEVKRIGPGTSLAHKVTQAMADLSRGNLSGTCATLTAFIYEVRAQRGKSISPSRTGDLISQAQQIRAALHC